MSRSRSKPLWLSLLLCSSSLSGVDTEQIRYHIVKGNISIACDLYTDWKKEHHRENLLLLQDLGLRLLREGISSHDPEIQFFSLWGAGISGDDRAFSILQKGIISRNPHLQMTAVQFVADRQHDATFEMLSFALASPFLPVRLKALSALIKSRSAKALPHLESLMQKVSPETRALFAEMLIVHGGVEATRILKKLLTVAEEQTIVTAILTMARTRRDDLLPEIYRLSTGRNAAIQEACAYALGLFKDLSRVHSLANSPVATVRLAAFSALGRRIEVEALAREGMLPAIQALAHIEESETLLYELQDSSASNVRLNAAQVLLRKKLRLKTECYREIFIRDHRDLVFVPLRSPGNVFTSWNVVPCARQRFANAPEVFENSQKLREQLLLQALEISESETRLLSELLFENDKNDLVPLLTRTLADIKSPETIELLKIYREKPGAPRIRNYCNLALYRAKVDGPYANTLIGWIEDHRGHALTFSNVPEETSQLFLDSIEAMIQLRDERVLPLLLDLIRYGNPKNRYALAGILIRASST